MAEKTISAESAWARLFGELTAALRVPIDGQELPLDVALSRLQDSDRDTRRTVAEAVSTALEPGLRTRAFIYNTLVYDKAVDDRLRAYPHWLASRNLANEASDESVMALVEAVRGRFDIPQRWYTLKAQLLGIDRLADYDRSAPVLPEDVTFSYAESRELVLDTYEAFSPEAGRVVRRFFDEQWVDAPVRPHKRGGAFCAYTVPSVHPYVLLNFTARRRDVLTMAHELGHGLHAALAQPQGVFHQSTPLTLAETASVFGEALVFGRMLDAAPDDDARLSLLAERIDGAIATVFRQMAMNRFEHLIHTRRRSEGELSMERINESWVEAQSELFGDSVEITDGYRMWWSYVPHFINTPGYVYAYAYGQLLALSVYGRYLRRGHPLPLTTSSFWPRAARARPRSWARWSASTSPIRGSGTRAWTWSSSSCATPRSSRSSASRRAGQWVWRGRVRARSSWRSTTLAISLMICSIPVTLASPCSKAVRQSLMCPLMARSLNFARGISRRTLASVAMSLVTLGPGSSTRYIWMSRPPRSSSPATSLSGCRAGTSSRNRVTAVSIRLLVSAGEVRASGLSAWTARSPRRRRIAGDDRGAVLGHEGVHHVWRDEAAAGSRRPAERGDGQSAPAGAGR